MERNFGEAIGFVFIYSFRGSYRFFKRLFVMRIGSFLFTSKLEYTLINPGFMSIVFYLIKVIFKHELLFKALWPGRLCNIS